RARPSWTVAPRNAGQRLLQQRAQHPAVLLVGVQALGQQVDRRVVAGVVGGLEYLARRAANRLVADDQLTHHFAPVGRLGQAGLLGDRGQLAELGIRARGVEAKRADALGDFVQRGPLLGV